MLVTTTHKRAVCIEKRRWVNIHLTLRFDSIVKLSLCHRKEKANISHEVYDYRRFEGYETAVIAVQERFVTNGKDTVRSLSMEIQSNRCIKEAMPKGKKSCIGFGSMERQEQMI